MPQNQQVTLTRAVFDQGGYQLYDTVGETIVVPFTNQNLYVMKFGQSTNGHMYFVNDGSDAGAVRPQERLPGERRGAGGALVSVRQGLPPGSSGLSGHRAELVRASSAWGGTPTCTVTGGYYSNTAFMAGGVFLPTVGLFFEIGGHPYYGWHGYHDYFLAHPAFYPVAYFHRDYYRWADRPVLVPASVPGRGPRVLRPP